MKKRKFSPAQLAAQKRFAALAKAGKLRRKNGKKKNTTIIKAKKISHLDVSKVHNGKKRTVSARRNAEHRDAAHPIHVRDYWQGRKGYKSQWQRAHEAGQRQLFGVKNPTLTNAQISELVKLTQALPSYRAAALAWEKYEIIKESAAPAKLVNAARKSAHVAHRRYQKEMKAIEKKYVADLKKKNANQPTAEQLKAIRQFASVNGPRWKSELRYLWETGAYHRAALGGADSAYLQQIRNQFGPGWLKTFKISKANPRRGTRKIAGFVKRVTKTLGRKTPSELTKRHAQVKIQNLRGKRAVSAVARRRNGANTNLAKQRRAEFVGRPSTKTKTLYAPNGSGASGTLAQLGKLHKLHIKGGKTYNFKGVPTLAQHPKTDQLFVLGKNYTVNAPKKNPGDRMVDLGEVKTIEYEAVKTHLGDSKPVRYYHHFGEEGGERPHALVNEEGLIIFSGGDYYIRPEGIRD